MIYIYIYKKKKAKQILTFGNRTHLQALISSHLRALVDFRVRT